MRYLKGIIILAVVVTCLSVSAVSFSGIKTNIEIKALENSGGSVVFYGETNLPDGTNLDVSWWGTSAFIVKNGEDIHPFSGDAEAVVENGKYQTDPLRDDERVLPGKVQVDISARECDDCQTPDVLTALKKHDKSSKIDWMPRLTISKDIQLKATAKRKKDDGERLAELKAEIGAVNQIEAEVKELFDELMSMKNNNQFWVYGASTAGPYSGWFERARALQEHPHISSFMGLKDSSAPLDFYNLAIDYVRSKGKETKDTDYYRKEFDKAFKTKVELVSK